MSKPVRLIVPVISMLVPAAVAAQEVVVVDTYWQRESGVKEFDELSPFRSPKGIDIHQRGKLADLMRDLIEMKSLANQADEKELYFDKTGRQICKHPKWAEVYGNVKATSLLQEGWVGNVFRQSTSVVYRRASAYGFFYFNNNQLVIDLIAMLPGEPERIIRADSFERALQFLRVHLPESKPQNPKFDNGIVVPRYKFNPGPFMQLLDQKSPIDQAQGLWFLTEVLRIRHDLGKAYLGELSERLPRLLTSESPMVRTRTLDFLTAVDPKRGRAPDKDSSNADRMAWFEKVEYDLFPPIRHVSTGRCDLYPSRDVTALVKAGKRLLSLKALLPPGSAKTKSSHRYGVTVVRAPAPLHKLGIPLGALIVNINGSPVRNAAEMKTVVDEEVVRFKKANKAHEDYLRTWRPANKDDEPRPRKLLTYLVEYVYRGKIKIREFRYGLHL